MMFQYLKNLLKREEGQSMVEYGLIIGLVVVGVIVLVATLGGQLQTIFTNITNGLTGQGINPPSP